MQTRSLRQSERILALPRYGRAGASSRLRFESYFTSLRDAGLAVDALPLLEDSHVLSLYEGRNLLRPSLVRAYLRRLKRLLRCSEYDLVWIEKEVFPWVPLVEELLLNTGRVKYVVDIDDAWFLRYGQSGHFAFAYAGKLERIARRATLVIAANTVLADWARRADCARVEVIPTVVDPLRYPIADHGAKERARIVWIGTPVTVRYLEPLLQILRDLTSEHDVELIVVGAAGFPVPDGLRVSCLPWTEESEGRVLASCDIGVMPLADGEWERGKSGYKLIQCMAAGLPVVASPVGANIEIVAPEVGLLAATPIEWRGALSALLANRNRRAEMGRAGRERVERDYSVHIWGRRIVSLFREVIA